jgi:integrase
MASIHKDPRGKSPYWYVAYTLADGRRAFRSTKQTDRKKAWDVARALEKTSEKARVGELTAVAVRKMFDDLLASIGQEPLHNEAARKFVLSWLAGKELSTKPAVYKHYKRTVLRFLHFLGERADKPLAGIQASDIAAYRDHRLGGGVSSGTLILDLKLLRSVFSVARRQGLILHSPAETVELPANKPLERDVFSPEELCALLGAADYGEWRTLILLGYYLGARLSDAAVLRWDCVDLATRRICYTQGKTGRLVQVPIHPDLEAELLRIAHSDNPRGHLCPSLANKRIDGRCGLSAQFGRLMRAAGVDPQVVQSAHNRFSRKSFHALRHSFSSALANAGVAADVRMKLVGHRSSATHQRYTHLEFAPLQAAIAGVPSIARTWKDAPPQ